jgi:carbamoyl-phosphate synthase large subunit
MDKLRLIQWLAARGFTVPRTVYVETEADLGKVDFCPAVLKPTLGGGGSANVLLAQDERELLFLGRSLLGNIGPYIAQEYMGTVDSEYTVGVLSDMDGNLVHSIAVRRMIMSGLSNRIKVRNRTGKAELGAFLAISSGVSQGDVGRFPEVAGPCEAISQALAAAGAINVQCRFVDGRVYVFEINPRFSGTTSLRAMMGYNEPDWLIRKHVLREDLPARFPYRSGRIVRGLSETVISGKGIARAE